MPRGIAPQSPPRAFRLNTQSPQAQGLRAWYPTSGGQRPSWRNFTGDTVYDLTTGTPPTMVADRDKGFVGNFTVAGSQQLYRASLRDHTPPVMLSAWVKLASLPPFTVPIVLLVDSTNGYGYRLQVTAAGEAQAYSTGNTTYGEAFSAASITTGVWHHIAAVFNSNAHRVAYLNGVAGTADTTDNGGTAAITIDRIQVGSASFTDARITDARIYGSTASHAFKSGEVAALFHCPWDLYLPPKRPAARTHNPARYSTTTAVRLSRRASNIAPVGWFGVRRQSLQAKDLMAWLPTIDAPSTTTLRDRIGRFNLSGVASPTLVPDRDEFRVVEFNGTTQAFDRTGLAAGFLPTSYSVTMRFKADSFAGSPVAFSFGGTTSGYIQIFYFDTGGVPNLYRETPGGINLASSTAVSPGVWYSLAVTVAPNAVNIYIDGKLNAGPLNGSGNGEDTSQISRITWSGRYYPGSAPVFDNSFDGKMADYRLYGRALSPQAVARIHQNRWDLYDSLLSRRKVVPVLGLTPSTFNPAWASSANVFIQ